ncbi:uncharacterized protein At2g29880-like [Asparagus officinalis]|uniref:uncharacterized protein At2g29880-like n=1 Tax=Asparagus officinalis TaxID=4686 RepID=UPI00098E4A6C|nr:uncharacterized protein At2g29880-like [Asparagus officinalis]
MDIRSQSQDQEEIFRGLESEGQKRAMMDYMTWTEAEANELLRLLVEEVKNGNKQANDSFKKYVILKNVIPPLVENFGKDFRYNHVMNKIKQWMRKIAPVEIVMKNNSGFGWDPTTQKFTGPDEVWNSILEARPNTPNLKDKLFENFEDILMVCGDHGASGKGAIGLGPDGLDEARLEEVVGEGILGADAEMESPDRGDATIDMQHATTVPSDNVPFSGSGPSNLNNGKRRRRSIGTAATSSASSQLSLQEVGEGVVTVGKAFHELVDELRKIRKGRNKEWVDAVMSTSELTKPQKWNILSDNISQDMKDAFIDMDAKDRYEFLHFRLTGEIMNDGKDETQTNSDPNGEDYDSDFFEDV